MNVNVNWHRKYDASSNPKPDFKPKELDSALCAFPHQKRKGGRGE
jgi:hypothetical protein